MLMVNFDLCLLKDKSAVFCVQFSKKTNWVCEHNELKFCVIHKCSCSCFQTVGTRFFMVTFAFQAFCTVNTNNIW